MGSPMGSDLATFMSISFRFNYEDKWIRKSKAKDLYQARKFSYMFRFIDDLAIINDGWEFEKVYSTMK